MSLLSLIAENIVLLFVQKYGEIERNETVLCQEMVKIYGKSGSRTLAATFVHACGK